MSCADLAATGADLAWVGLIVIALVLLVVGIALYRGRRHRAGTFAVLVILCVGGSVVIAPAPGAQAACSTSPPAETNSLTIVQTSINTGLSPTQAPSAIVGRVTNNGPDETYVTAIVASIVSVVPAADAAAGSCDASDYALIDPRMLVGEQLAASGGSAVFSGARIALHDKTSNQDACEGAVVELRYEME
jgi:hypothetical protein